MLSLQRHHSVNSAEAGFLVRFASESQHVCKRRGDGYSSEGVDQIAKSPTSQSSGSWSLLHSHSVCRHGSLPDRVVLCPLLLLWKFKIPGLQSPTSTTTKMRQTRLYYHGSLPDRVVLCPLLLLWKFKIPGLQSPTSTTTKMRQTRLYYHGSLPDRVVLCPLLLLWKFKIPGLQSPTSTTTKMRQTRLY
ncbi:hypothetical protein Q8A73_021552 [Channa argus]|nr:hypothetical protein Q8A73_021552 [Channa argus]